MKASILEDEIINIDRHRQRAIDVYRVKRTIYVPFVSEIERILLIALRRQQIKVACIDSRAKDVESFGKKASKPSVLDPNLPKYKDPLNEITDQAGVRIVTFFPKMVNQVDQVINTEFFVQEKHNKADDLQLEGRFGYQSVHYLVQFKSNRTSLPEYAQYKGLIAEIQVRTILQHAWAEIEHDMQYKADAAVSLSTRRQFLRLAALLEVAESEFQALQDCDEQLRHEATFSAQESNLRAVEITPETLKAYLDKKLRSDKRMTCKSYDWTARLLLKLGFTQFRQVEDCIGSYNEESVNRLVWKARQGQLLRFETLLLAGMGSYYMEQHPLNVDSGWVKTWEGVMERLVKGGITIKGYLPC
jgi:putative GTP pyrophosphokinase